MPKKLTTEEFIIKAKKVHGDKFDYSQVEYINAITKVIITCPIHGEFLQTPDNHLHSNGCSRCSGSYRPTTEEFILRSKEVWGEDTFDYSKFVYVNDKTKFTLTCKKHNIEFEQISDNHLKGKIGCSLCYEEIYGSKSSGYWTYERCYGTAKKYEWLSDFIKGDEACYSTSYKKGYLKDFTWLKRNYEKDENVLTAKKHCIYKYEFHQFNSVYIGLTVNLDRRYSEHTKQGSVYNFCKTNNLDMSQPQIIEENLSLDEAREREDYWIDYYKKQGYKLLNKAKAGSVGMLHRVKTGKEAENFIEKAKKVHGDKYGYSRVVYKNNRTKVIITCPTHGEFEQRPHDHLNGNNCPKCGGTMKLTTEEFIVKARKIHGDRYDYTNVVYKNTNTKVIIICSVHGYFEQIPLNHLKGKGCPKCGVIKCSKSITKWTYEACKIESKKYMSRNEFRKGSCGAYESSKRNGWLNDFFPKK